MGNMNPEGSQTITQQKKERIHKLAAFKKLIDEKGHHEDVYKLLSEYLDNFELLVNTRYITQALSAGFSWWIITPALAAKYLLVPELIGQVINLYLSIASLSALLHYTTNNDYETRLMEMKFIYNVLLKESNEHYTPAIDNSAQLNHPEVQRLIKLIAPLCTPKFMQAWPSHVQQVPTYGASHYVSSLYNGVTGFFGAFKKTSGPTPIDIEALEKLKTQVERGELIMNTSQALFFALNFFSTDPRFRELCKTSMPMPLNLIPQMAEAAFSKRHGH